MLTLASKYDATPAQIVLAWHLGRGNVVIPKSTRKERISENLASAAIRLTEDELAAIDGLEAGARIGADPAVAAFSQF